MKKLRRLIWYLASRLLLILLLLSLFTVVFYYAMNAANIYIVLKDGMAKRAQVIMMGESPSELTKFFQGSYLQKDENLQIAIDGKSPYTYYNVRGIDHRLTMTWGVIPCMVGRPSTGTGLYMQAVRGAVEALDTKVGDIIVVTAGMPVGRVSYTNTMRVIQVTEDYINLAFED